MFHTGGQNAGIGRAASFSYVHTAHIAHVAVAHTAVVHAAVAHIGVVHV